MADQKITFENMLETASREITKTFEALESIEGKTDSEAAFISHASEFQTGRPIPNYPQWSERLGKLRDRVISENQKEVVIEFAKMFTDLVWGWEYGALDGEGYMLSIKMSSYVVGHTRVQQSS